MKNNTLYRHKYVIENRVTVEGVRLVVRVVDVNGKPVTPYRRLYKSTLRRIIQMEVKRKRLPEFVFRGLSNIQIGDIVEEINRTYGEMCATKSRNNPV